MAHKNKQEQQIRTVRGVLVAAMVASMILPGMSVQASPGIQECVSDLPLDRFDRSRGSSVGKGVSCIGDKALAACHDVLHGPAEAPTDCGADTKPTEIPCDVVALLGPSEDPYPGCGGPVPCGDVHAEIKDLANRKGAEENEENTLCGVPIEDVDRVHPCTIAAVIQQAALPGCGGDWPCGISVEKNSPLLVDPWPLCGLEDPCGGGLSAVYAEDPCESMSCPVEQFNECNGVHEWEVPGPSSRIVVSNFQAGCHIAAVDDIEASGREFGSFDSLFFSFDVYKSRTVTKHVQITVECEATATLSGGGGGGFNRVVELAHEGRIKGSCHYAGVPPATGCSTLPFTAPGEATGTFILEPGDKEPLSIEVCLQGAWGVSNRDALLGGAVVAVLNKDDACTVAQIGAALSVPLGPVAELIE